MCIFFKIMNCLLESQWNNYCDTSLSSKIVYDLVFMWFLWGIHGRQGCIVKNNYLTKHTCSGICAVASHHSLPHSLNNTLKPKKIAHFLLEITHISPNSESLYLFIDFLDFRRLNLLENVKIFQICLCFSPSVLWLEKWLFFYNILPKADYIKIIQGGRQIPWSPSTETQTDSTAGMLKISQVQEPALEHMSPASIISWHKGIKLMYLAYDFIICMEKYLLEIIYPVKWSDV